MSDNIILIGFMGTGKDVVGKQIARKTGMSFLSVDEFIELRENKTISRIFEESGEGYFRRLEKEAVLAIKDLKNTVVATGGGIVIDEENRRLLSKMGTVIHLEAKLDLIEERLRDDFNRPLIQDKKNIKRIFKERKGIYDFAELKIDTSFKNPHEIADEIIQKGNVRKRDRNFPLDTIVVKSELKNYPVHVGSGILTSNKNFIRLLDLNTNRTIVITNPLVGALYLQSIEDALNENKVNPIHFIVPDGEEYKTLEMATRIYDFLLENKVTRSEPIIALGGGVIGDLAGFVAATYKRGVPLIQIPTTLLAQVDASIGGKTGVDHKLGKNMIGAFYQPDSVITDVAVLLSLSEREFRNGLAEVIKYGIIKDQKLFSLLEKKHNEILDRDINILTEIISRCIQIKRKIVQEDEREEKGIREILNYGHTIGHIIETLTGYSQYRHGEAVAIGMVEEARMAVRNGVLEEEDLKRLSELISSYGLPVEIPESISRNDVRGKILQDKKVRHGEIRMPIPEGIGRVVLREVRCETLL